MFPIKIGRLSINTFSYMNTYVLGITLELSPKMQTYSGDGELRGVVTMVRVMICGHGLRFTWKH